MVITRITTWDLDITCDLTMKKNIYSQTMGILLLENQLSLCEYPVSFFTDEDNLIVELPFVPTLVRTIFGQKLSTITQPYYRSRTPFPGSELVGIGGSL